MAINKNHLFEDLDGVKCAIVEKDISSDRKDFLKELLELNGYTVVVVPAPPPKAAPAKAAVTADGGEPVPAPEPAPAAEEKYILGVTDVTFNSTNAIFGRLLKTRSGRVVTMAFWNQKESVSRDEIPYFEHK